MKLICAAILASAALCAQENPEFDQWLRQVQMGQMERERSRAEYERARERAGLKDTPEKLELRRREAEFERGIESAHDAWAAWMKVREENQGRRVIDVKRVSLEAKKFAEMVRAINKLAEADGRPVEVKK